MVGKRKRDIVATSRSTKSKDATPPPADTLAENAQDVFRKYFEAQFEPLDLPNRPTNQPESHDDDEEDTQDEREGSESGSDWDGLSEASEDGNQVEVVEHKAIQTAPDDMMDKRARKAFMVGNIHGYRVLAY